MDPNPVIGKQGNGLVAVGQGQQGPILMKIIALGSFYGRILLLRAPKALRRSVKEKIGLWTLHLKRNAKS